MKISIILLWISLLAVSGAAPKFAVVRVTDIYQNLPSTVAMLKDIKAQQAAIPDNKRNVDFLASLRELKALEATLNAKRGELESEDGKLLTRNFEIKRQGALTLKKEYDEFKVEEEKRINKAMVQAIRSSLNRITAAAAQIAKERNFDGVLDTSGSSNTGLPVVLYVRNAVDISEDVIELLGEKPLNETEAAPGAKVEADQPAEQTDKSVE